MYNTLPQFEANQVLSNAHLNQIVEYLEEQGRLTRNHLLGYGVVSGLELKRTTATSISISEGVAVTSAGYLVLPDMQNAQVDNKGKRILQYNKKRNFAPQNILFPYKAGTQTLFNAYDLFAGAGTIKQLVLSSEPDSGDAAVEMLTQQDLDQNVLVLFFQIQVKELKSCEADSCMELGRQWNYSVVPLLLSKAGADTLIQNENLFNPAPAVNSNIDPFVHPAYYFPRIPLTRPDLSKVPETVAAFELAAIYRKTLLDLIKKLQEDQFKRVDPGLQLILGEYFSAGPLANFINRLGNELNNTALAGSLSFFQYLYSFAKDFCDAYAELKEALFAYSSFEIPASNSFPHHVRIGSVPALNKVVSSMLFPPDPYRHGFISSRNIDRQREALHQVVGLYMRLNMLSQNLNAASLKINDIRITPGVENGRDFSYKAMPFYYNPLPVGGSPDPKICWNPRWSRMANSNRVLNYYDNAHTSNPGQFKNGIDISKDELLHLPLVFRHDEKDFYRIEGHAGAAYTDVFKTVSEYIHNYNLPFDLQLLRLNKATVMLVKDKRVIFDDLESLYNVLREEIRCLLTTELNYFSNIRLTKLVKQATQRASQQALATKEAAAKPQESAAPSEAVFYRTLSKRDSSISEMKMQNIDLGIQDSIYSLVDKFGGKVSIGDIAGIIGGAGGISVAGVKSTPAAPFVSKMISSINALQKVLDLPFDNFKQANYETALSALENDTKSFILFAKSHTDAQMRDDSNITKGELLDYLDRIFYECDFEKLSALSVERDRREQKIGINNYLQQYISENPGLEHRGGVWKNGTFVVLFNENGVVIGDYCLPYRCCGGSGATQFVLGVLKTVLLAGQVLDVNGGAVKGATVTLNDEPLVLDEQANFRKSVPPKSFLVLKAAANGFVSKEISINAGEDDILQNIVLFTQAQELSVNVIITVQDAAAKPLANAVVMLDDKQISGDANAVFKAKLKAGTTATLTINAPGFKSYTQPVITASEDLPLLIKLTRLIKLQGVIIDSTQKPVLNAKVSINGALVPLKENKFETILESKLVYNMVVEAENLEKFTEVITAGDADIPLKTIVLQRIATFSVRTGVFIDWNALDNLRAEMTRIGRTGVVNPVFTTRNPTPPTQQSQSAFLTNNDAGSAIDNKPQTYNPDLKIFSSDETKGGHSLQIIIKAVDVRLGVKLAVEDNDIMILVPARKAYKQEGNFSATVRPDVGTDNMRRLNECFTKLFNMPSVSLFNRSIEFRFFTESDLKVFAEALKTSNVVAQFSSTR